MKLALTILAFFGLLLVAPVAVAAETPPPSAAYDLSKLKGICGYVYDRTRAPAGSGHRYVYGRLMEEAAGVTPADDATTKKRKVQMLWRDNQSVFTCTASNFNLANGNLLKYSVSSRSYNFINTALGQWELELNFIDPVDRRTLLDYLRRELDANRGNSDESALKNLYDASRERGAKFCYELIDASNCGYSNMNQTSRSVVEAYNQGLQNAR